MPSVGEVTDCAQEEETIKAGGVSAVVESSARDRKRVRFALAPEDVLKGYGGTDFTASSNASSLHARQAGARKDDSCRACAPTHVKTQERAGAPVVSRVSE